jgi:hypothetical protein
MRRLRARQFSQIVKDVRGEENCCEETEKELSWDEKKKR